MLEPGRCTSVEAAHVLQCYLINCSDHPDAPAVYGQPLIDYDCHYHQQRSPQQFVKIDLAWHGQHQPTPACKLLLYYLPVTTKREAFTELISTHGPEYFERNFFKKRTFKHPWPVPDLSPVPHGQMGCARRWGGGKRDSINSRPARFCFQEGRPPSFHAVLFVDEPSDYERTCRGIPVFIAACEEGKTAFSRIICLKTRRPTRQKKRKLQHFTTASTCDMTAASELFSGDGFEALMQVSAFAMWYHTVACDVMDVTMG